MSLNSVSHCWLWPLLIKDWQDSIWGVTAIQNHLLLKLFEQAISSLPHQSMGMYLYEGQGWERALIYFWNRYGHGNLIGVSHSTVAYWHLMYFYDQRIFADLSPNRMPKPDKITVNGTAMKKILLQGGYDNNDLVDVEAIRYLHVKNTDSTKSITSSLNQLTWLVLGDITSNSTQSMLAMLNKVDPAFYKKNRLLFKTHPANPIKLKSLTSVEIETTDQPLEKLLMESNCIITTVNSASAIEAYAAGVAVITILDGHNFNASPLRGKIDCHFVCTADELRQALDQVRSHQPIQNSDDIFWTDPEIPRWKALLGLVERPAIKISSQIYEKEPLL